METGSVQDSFNHWVLLHALSFMLDSILCIRKPLKAVSRLQAPPLVPQGGRRQSILHGAPDKATGNTIFEILFILESKSEPADAHIAGGIVHLRAEKCAGNNRGALCFFAQWESIDFGSFFHRRELSRNS